jgi:hypothetical protein
MATYPTKLIEAFASQALKVFYMNSVSDAITNSDYEGQIKDTSSRLNVLTFGKLSARDYDDSIAANGMTAQDLTESNAMLITDQRKYFYFRVKDWDTFRSYIKNPENTIVEQVGNEIKKVVDTFVLGFYSDAGAGNHIGSATYTTGTVAVAATTGVVTGTGTTFTAAMVGMGFKATGMTSWYRIKTFTSTTSITIEDDKDDESSAYTGGVIAGGTAYIIDSVNTALALTKSNVFATMTNAAQILTDQEIPYENRFLVVPARVASLIRQAPEFISQGTESGRTTVLNGMLGGQFAGFNVYEVSDSRISGNNASGYHCLAGHKSAICFAMGLVRNQVEQDIIGNFGKAYKSLYVYGAKVADERRKALVDIFVTA